MTTRRITLAVLVVGTLILSSVLSAGSLGRAQDNPTPTPNGTPGGLANPLQANAVITETLPFDETFLQRLQLPEGFSVNVFARNLGNVRWMAVAPDGTLLVTRRREGDVIALQDQDNDGLADNNAFTVVASNLPYVHGITIREGRVYLATDTSVFTASVGAGGVLGPLSPLITDLPTGGQHPNRTLAFGPDDMLYITVGSTCNACEESDPENATILRAQPNGTQREIFARGLRNTIGFGWHPATGQLWGMDHGTDWRGDDAPPEELNLIVQETHYGWPWCFSNQQPDLYIPAPPPGGLGRAAFCQQTAGTVLEYTAHAAPIGMVFYTADQFPEEYRNDAFVAMRGSWNRNPPSGYSVVRIVFDDNGQPTEFQSFLTGFLIEEQAANFGRLAGVVIAADGSLLIAEDQNGFIYRISYTQ